MPSKHSARKFTLRLAVDIALNSAILVALIIIRSPVLKQLAAGQLFNSVEPQLFITPLHSDIGSPQCPESGSRSSSSLQTCTVIVGSFVHALIFVGISTSPDEMKQVQAFLGIIVKGGLFLISKLLREYAGRSLCMATYSVKTLRARLEAIPRHIGFPACLGVTTCLFFPMINRLKLAITCLFFFGLGVIATMVYNHFQSLSTYAYYVTSGDFSLLASDFTDLAETLFVTITESNSVLATVLFSLGLRLLVRSILSFSTLISSQNEEAEKLGLKAALLVNDEEKQDNTILVEDKSFTGSDKDTLCDDDETLNSNMGDDGEDDPEKNISSPSQEANGIKKDGLKERRREVSIIRNPARYSDYIPSLRASPDRRSKQQAVKLNSRSQYTSSLSAFTPEFVPRSAPAVCDAVQDYYPSHWTVASPVSVRITTPVKHHCIGRGAFSQRNVENRGV